MRAAGAQFDILAFPCNQFKNQEPFTNEEVATFARSTYGVEFPLFAKIDVNGPNQHPVFAQLKAALTDVAPETGAGRDIEWNFVSIDQQMSYSWRQHIFDFNDLAAILVAMRRSRYWSTVRVWR